jgi:hypothetical protein
MRKLLVRTALAAAAISTLGACASINERAWANGQGMSATSELRTKMRPEMAFATPGELFSTQRNLYNRSNPLSVASPVRWTPSRTYDR